MIKHQYLLLFIPLILLACNNDAEPGHDKSLVGTWLYVEYGFSPGAGYFVEKVPTNPPQTITFTADGKVVAEGEKLAYYKGMESYHIIDESERKFASLVFKGGDKTDSVNHSIENDTLKIRQFCIEGCHDGFIRVTNKAKDE